MCRRECERSVWIRNVLNYIVVLCCVVLCCVVLCCVVLCVVQSLSSFL